MKSSSSFLLVVIALICTYSLHAQEKWGKVSKEILTMERFEADTTADAVILFDVAEQKISADFIAKLRRHVRIKILTEKGKTFADVRIPYYKEDNLEDIKAHAISPSGKKTKLSGGDIHEEKINRYWNGKIFAIPGVEIGSVVEYKYELTTEILWKLDPWYFQNESYTKISEFSIKLDPRFNYNVFYQNVMGAEAEPERSEYLIPGRRTRKGVMVTWRIEDIPPVTSEPYMKNSDDYRMALYFQLLEYKDPGYYYKFIKEWDDLAVKLHDLYKNHYDKKGELREKVYVLCPDSLSEEEKIRVLYNFVRDNIDTKRIYGIYPDQSPEEVLEKRIGEISEKNMLLTSLLQHVGIEAYPLLTSTRTHGVIRTNWPQLDQFNLLMVYARSGSKDYLLDTGEKFCPFNLLPENDLVDIGYLLKNENGQFIKLPQTSKLNMKYCRTDAELYKDGNLKCSSELRFEGYEAINMRKKLIDEDYGEFFQDWLSDKFANALLDTFIIRDFDNVELPLQVRLDFSVDEYAQVIGDMIYFNPPQVNKLGKNPFKKETRTFPVDYAYLVGMNEEISVTLPPGYAVEEIPDLQLLKINGGHFLCDCNEDSNVIAFNRQYLIKKLRFQPSEYKDLRDFHSRIIGLEEGQIVLSRKNSNN